MVEKFEYLGEWWLPNELKNKVAGTLRYTPEKGPVLEIIAHIKERGYWKSFEERKWLKCEIILGYCAIGKVTIYKPSPQIIFWKVSGLPIILFYPQIVFIGAHFKQLNDIKFKKMVIHYSHLDEWIDTSFEENLIQLEITNKISKSVSIDIESKGIKISFIFSSSTPSELEAGFHIYKKSQIEIETYEDKSIEDYLKNIFHIRNFLSLVIGESIYPLNIKGLTQNYERAEIFLHVPQISRIGRSLLPFTPVFTFKEILDKINILLRNWFEKKEFLETICDLYFGTLYNLNLDIKHKFLSLIQAIDIFYRQKYNGKYLKDEEYKEVYEKVIEAIPRYIPKSLKERLKEYLRYGNEFSLRKKLKEIFKKYKKIIDIFIEIDKNIFINKVVSTRHYLVHYDKEKEKEAAGDEELYYLIQQLKFLLGICLLNEIGFTLEEIKTFFVKNIKKIT